MYNPQVRVVDLDPCMGKFVDVRTERIGYSPRFRGNGILHEALPTQRKTVPHETFNCCVRQEKTDLQRERERND